jgi:hypothetical protein
VGTVKPKQCAKTPSIRAEAGIKRFAHETGCPLAQA